MTKMQISLYLGVIIIVIIFLAIITGRSIARKDAPASALFGLVSMYFTLIIVQIIAALLKQTTIIYDMITLTVLCIIIYFSYAIEKNKK